MRKISYLMLVAVVAFSSCQDTNFKKGKEGIEYKIISGGGGEKLKQGQFMQIHVSNYYTTAKKDSLLSDTRERGPMVEALDSTTTPAAYYEILARLKNHDSLILRVLTDSQIVKAPDRVPAWLKKGNYITTTVKVLNIFNNRKEADSARMVQMHIQQAKDSVKQIEQIAKDDKTLKGYFTKNNINPVKAPLGTYVEMVQPGTGANVDTASIAVINYTGRTLDGKEFDSNTDSTKGHLEPLKVNMTKERIMGTINVIKGWTDGLSLLNKGAKAKFYIPSSLGYGPGGQGESIPPNTILMFDIEVVDIISKDKAKTDAKELMEKYKTKQKAYNDSMAKTRALMDTSHKHK